MKEIRYILYTILVVVIMSCNDHKSYSLQPAYNVKDYTITKANNKFILKKNVYENYKPEEEVFVLEGGEYYWVNNGIKCLFMSTKRDVDSVYDCFPLSWPHRIIIKRLSKDVIYSALIPDPPINWYIKFAFYYDNDYNILKIESQENFVIYTPNGHKTGIDSIFWKKL